MLVSRAYRVHRLQQVGPQSRLAGLGLILSAVGELDLPSGHLVLGLPSGMDSPGLQVDLAAACQETPAAHYLLGIYQGCRNGGMLVIKD